MALTPVIQDMQQILTADLAVEATVVVIVLEVLVLEIPVVVLVEQSETGRKAETPADLE